MIFKKIGKNTNISPMVRFHSPEMIEIGDNVRIDDFCVLSGGIGLTIGSHIHIACGVYLFAGAGIVLEDFVQVASRTIMLSQSDDMSGRSLVGPCIPIEYKPFLKSGLITIKRHTFIGTGTTIVPGVTIGEGVSVGAMSLVKEDLAPWAVYAGVPAKRIKERSKEILTLETAFLENYCG